MNPLLPKNIIIPLKTASGLICVTLAVGLLCSTLPVLVIVGIVICIIISFKIVALPFTANDLVILLLFILYSNIIKYITGVRYSLLINEFIVLLVFVKAIAIKLRAGVFHEIAPALNIALSVFLVICLIELFNPNVPNIMAALEGLRKTSFYMIGFIIAEVFVQDINLFRRLLRAIVYGSVPIIVYGIKQALIPSSLDHNLMLQNWSHYATMHIFGWQRPIGIFSGPFHFAMLCVIVMLGSLYLLLENRQRLYLFIIALSFFGVLLAMTRTNIIATLMLLLFTIFILLTRRRISKFRIIAYGILIIALFLAILRVTVSWYEPINDMYNSLSQIKYDTRWMDRFIVWHNISNAIQERPIIAYGMGSAGDTIENIYSYQVHFTSHNIILKILVETGVIGLLFYALFLIGWMIVAYHCLISKDEHIKNAALLVIGIFIMFMINGLSISAVEAYPINFITWFFMGALVKLYSEQRIMCITHQGS